MCKYQFPEHSMIIKSADFVEKLKEVETLQQENKNLKEALKRLASTEGFYAIGILPDDDMWAQELKSRCKYAQNALKAIK